MEPVLDKIVLEKLSSIP